MHKKKFFSQEAQAHCDRLFLLSLRALRSPVAVRIRTRTAAGVPARAHGL